MPAKAVVAAAILAVVVLSFAFLAGCKDSGPRVPPHTCLFAGLGEDDPLWPILKASARSYVGTARSLQVQFVAPAKSDPAAVAGLVFQALDRRVSAVCLQSNGDDATRQLVTDLTQRGTPVVLIGQDMPDSGRFGYVGWDEREAGKTLAAALKASLRDRTTYMLLHADAAGGIYASRAGGFGVGMQDYTFLKELHRYDCQADPAEALKIFAEQGRRYPKLGGWACLGDWPARVRLQDLRGSLPMGTSLVLVGALPPVWPLLEQGLCQAAVGTDYGRWGYEAVSLSELAYHHAVKPGETRLTEPRIVLAEDFGQYKKDWVAWGEGKINARPPGPERSVASPK
jgi:ribose transport system substrate-binding protein